MRVYLNAGFGRPLGADLAQIEGRGFYGVRQDVPAERAEGLVWEFAFARQALLALVGGGEMEASPAEIAAAAQEVALAIRRYGVGAAIEAGNEPNISPRYRDDPEGYAEAVRLSAELVRGVDPRIPIVAGGISNTSEHALDYLERALPRIPEGVILGFHGYRPTGGGPDTPQRGFKSRMGELHRLAALDTRRRLWNTETGFHTAPEWVRRRPPLCWFRRTVRRTDADVARYWRRELELNRRAGVRVVVVYQLQDGPREDVPADRYGIREADGVTWKPSAEVARW